MAGADRDAADPVGGAAALRQDARKFSLFAALRMIEAQAQGLHRLGESRRPAEDLVRLGQVPHLEFARSEIADFDRDSAGRDRLQQYVFGAFGPNGALPLHLTELAFERTHHYDDPAFAEFVNLFHHRLIALFYRAWAQADPTTQAERPATDEFFGCLAALIGMLGAAASNRDAVDDGAKLARAGILGQQTRSADALTALLAEYFEVPVELRPYCPRWLSIPEDARLRLGRMPEYARLGLSSTIGKQSWQVQHSFEVALGPLDMAGLLAFLPGEPALESLRALVRLYTNDEWQWQVRIVVRAGAVPPLRLGQGAHLGWSSWIGERITAADDVVLAGDAPLARVAASRH